MLLGGGGGRGNGGGGGGPRHGSFPAQSAQATKRKSTSKLNSLISHSRLKRDVLDLRKEAGAAIDGCIFSVAAVGLAFVSVPI